MAQAYPRQSDAQSPASWWEPVTAGTPLSKGRLARGFVLATDGAVTIDSVTCGALQAGVLYPRYFTVIDACPAGTVAWG